MLIEVLQQLAQDAEASHDILLQQQAEQQTALEVTTERLNAMRSVVMKTMALISRLEKTDVPYASQQDRDKTNERLGFLKNNARFEHPY